MEKKIVRVLFWVSLAVSALSWWMVIFGSASGIFVSLMFVSTPLCWALLPVLLFARKKPAGSPFRIFAISMLVWILITAGIGLFDIFMHTQGLFAGLLGTILLFIAVPVMLGLLLLDGVLWLIFRRKSEK